VRGKELFCLVAKILTFERGKSRDFCSTRVAAQMGEAETAFGRARDRADVDTIADVWPAVSARQIRLPNSKKRVPGLGNSVNAPTG